MSTRQRSRSAPSGDVRLTVNIRSALHTKLKMAAIMAKTTCGELIEKFVEDKLDEMLRKGIE